MIHNTVYRCVEAGWFTADAFRVDWNRVAQADAIVVRLLPPRVRATLDGWTQQYLALIAAEVTNYRPQTAGNALLGALSAVFGADGGGAEASSAPSGQAQTIDDVVYTIGDKMVHYSGG